MRLSISLTEADVAALDDDRQATGAGSRSAAVQQAVRHLTRRRLEEDHAAAWQEGDASGDRELWEGVVGAGMSG